MKDLSKKTILITGGTGFIGKPLCDMLTKQGAQLIVLSRFKKQTAPNIRYIRSIPEVFDVPIDIIINLAGEPIAQRWHAASKRKIYESRINTTIAVIDYIKTTSHKPSLLISGSAIGYYGADQAIEFNENTPPSTNSPYARQLCAAWENTAIKAKQYGVRTVLLRIGAVLEKDGGMLAKLITPFKLGLGGFIGNGQQWLSWIDRDDLLRLIMHIINTPSMQGAINATSPYPVTNLEFSKTLANSLHRPCLFFTPSFILRIIFGDMADEIMLAGQKVLPQKALESGFVFSYEKISHSFKKIFIKENAS